MRACVFSLKVTHDLEAGTSENLLLLLVGETNKKKMPGRVGFESPL